MTRSLNTSDAQYANVLAVIGFDGGVPYDAVTPSRTFTKDSLASYVAGGTLGDALRTVVSGDGYTQHGMTFSPGLALNSTSNGYTVICAFNSLTAGGGHGYLFGGSAGSLVPASIFDSSNNKAAVRSDISSAGTFVEASSGPNVGNAGAHSLSLTRAVGASQGARLLIDGVYQVTSPAGSGGSFAYDTLGGTTGYGSVGMDLVWLIVLSGVQSDAEILRIHNSMGAGGAMALLNPAASATTITTNPGNNTAAGVAATIVAATTISTTPGNNTAAGVPATVTNTVPGVVVSTTTGTSTAAGVPATVGAFIQTGQIPNNTGSIYANQAVVYTWIPNGRVGSMAGLTATDGTGTTDANGRFTPGIALTAGLLRIAVRNATAATDDVFEQYF